MQAAHKVAARAETAQEFKDDRPNYEAQFLRELGATNWTVDYSRAIEIALQIREQDDEDILFLM